MIFFDQVRPGAGTNRLHFGGDPNPDSECFNWQAWL